jgi:acetyl/propionyl-CoA carboxylase alpha subunit
MNKLVIANRGEIARRVLRTARTFGYEVAVISTTEDADALVRTEADEVLEVDDFLDGDAIVAASRRWGGDLLHPGYGFLSESARFAASVESAGIAFVGPVSQTMELLGNKEKAKELALRCGVPILDSLSSEDLADLEPSELDQVVRGRGLEPPFLVKAAGGGGGRGMRIVEDITKLYPTLERASEEAAASFGDPAVFVERYLEKPRHVEIQVFGDGEGGGVSLGERECSIQRRYQKVIEEAPSPVVNPSLRKKLSRAALALVAEAKYRGAGTVEFLLDEEGGFYFLEVNTRLQVEHPVTEAVLDLDLVAAQLSLAEGQWPSGLPEPPEGAILSPKRWAIEARVLAENPRDHFLPTPGPLRRYREPSGAAIRVDSGVCEGGRVHSRYDSMIAKVIATGENRTEAVERLSSALESMVIHGATSNLPFLQAVLRHPEFALGNISTDFIATHLDALNESLLPDPLRERVSTAGFREKLSFAARGDGASHRSPAATRFLALDNRIVRVGSDLELGPIEIEGDPSTGDVHLSGRGLGEVLAMSLEANFRWGPSLRDAIDRASQKTSHSRVEAVLTPVSVEEMDLTLFGETLRLIDPRARVHRRRGGVLTNGEVRTPMAGKVLEVRAKRGDRVEEGQVILVVESMKMQLEVGAPIGGRIAEVLVEPGQVLDGADVMATIEP